MIVEYTRTTTNPHYCEYCGCPTDPQWVSFCAVCGPWFMRYIMSKVLMAFLGGIVALEIS